jgi:hypothetical protein
VRCQPSQWEVALEPPHVRESPPRTPRSPPRTPICQRSRTPPTHSLYACNDDATLSIRQQQLLKYKYSSYTNKLALMTNILS